MEIRADIVINYGNTAWRRGPILWSIESVLQCTRVH